MTIETERELMMKCDIHLPKMLMVDGVNYRLSAYALASGNVFIIKYAEFDGNFFNWDNQPISLTYEIVDELPTTAECGEDTLQFRAIYKTSVDDILSDCALRLYEWHKGVYTELSEIISKEQQFHRELASLLNKYSKENGSDTPDFLLASYLMNCLSTFDFIIKSREKWYGDKSK